MLSGATTIPSLWGPLAALGEEDTISARALHVIAHLP